MPLDWSHPNGATISLSIHRLPALDPQHRIGALLINPGGPGGSATRLVDNFSGLYSAELKQRFDLVGVDPRGIGLSTPISCDYSLQPTVDDLYPRSQAEFDQMLAKNRAFGQSCLDRTGPLLAHVDTVSVARDLEAVRIALGESKLNWFGLSYGTSIGDTYAELFPGHFRVLAEDGVLDHSRPTLQMVYDESKTVEDSFNRFVGWCAAQTSCPLHGQDVGQLFDDLAAQADTTPIPAPAVNGTATGRDIRSAVQGLSINPQAEWPTLAEAIVEARNGDASIFAEVAAGAFAPGQVAVECMDFATNATTFDRVAAAELLVRLVSPHLRGADQSWTVLTGCVGWPLPPTNPQHPLHIQPQSEILYVNALHDPSTSYVWALNVAAHTPNSVLLTRDGDGHTSYFYSPCAAGFIDRYLIDLTVPPRGTVCSE